MVRQSVITWAEWPQNIPAREGIYVVQLRSGAITSKKISRGMTRWLQDWPYDPVVAYAVGIQEIHQRDETPPRERTTSG